MMFVIFYLSAILLAFLGLLVIMTFYRYRYENDRTPYFVTLFCIAFLVSILLSTYFLVMAGVEAAPIDMPTVDFPI